MYRDIFLLVFFSLVCSSRMTVTAQADTQLSNYCARRGDWICQNSWSSGMLSILPQQEMTSQSLSDCVLWVKTTCCQITSSKETDMTASLWKGGHTFLWEWPTLYKSSMHAQNIVIVGGLRIQKGQEMKTMIIPLLCDVVGHIELWCRCRIISAWVTSCFSFSPEGSVFISTVLITQKGNETTGNCKK